MCSSSLSRSVSTTFARIRIAILCSLINKEYKVYALFRKDYRKGESISNATVVKCFFYAGLCMLLFFKFSFHLTLDRFIFSVIATTARKAGKNDRMFDWLT